MREAIASILESNEDYDDGSYGPILVRLAWHASGRYAAFASQLKIHSRTKVPIQELSGFLTNMVALSHASSAGFAEVIHEDHLPSVRVVCTPDHRRTQTLSPPVSMLRTKSRDF